jgi:hypothetical protein
MSDFFDKLKQGINKGVATVTVKSQEMVDLTKLKTQIITVQSQKKDALEELGNLVYTMYSENNYDEARAKEKVAALVKLDTQIKDLENEIVKVQNTAREALGESAPETEGSQK